MINSVIKVLAHQIVVHIKHECINPDVALITGYIRRCNITAQVTKHVLNEFGFQPIDLDTSC